MRTRCHSFQISDGVGFRGRIVSWGVIIGKQQVVHRQEGNLVEEDRRTNRQLEWRRAV